MRDPLPGVTVLLDGTPTPGSTTIAAAGAYVLVIATALPEHAITLTSCYLGAPRGASAVSHLQLDADGEHLEQRILPPDALHATAAGACLLDHAATLRDALARTTSATVTADVSLDALQRAADAWGPPPPPAC